MSFTRDFNSPIFGVPFHNRHVNITSKRTPLVTLKVIFLLKVTRTYLKIPGCCRSAINEE
jgi:hypothetical protein